MGCFCTRTMEVLWTLSFSTSIPHVATDVLAASTVRPDGRSHCQQSIIHPLYRGAVPIGRKARRACRGGCGSLVLLDARINFHLRGILRATLCGAGGMDIGVR